MVTQIHEPPNGSYIVVANSTRTSVLNRPQVARTRDLGKDLGELANPTNDGSMPNCIGRESNLGPALHHSMGLKLTTYPLILLNLLIVLSCNLAQLENLKRGHSAPHDVTDGNDTLLMSNVWRISMTSLPIIFMSNPDLKCLD